MILSPPPTPSLCYIWLSRQIPDAATCRAADRLHHLQVQGRWLFNSLTWLLLLPPSLWAFQPEFQLWQQAFTWVALRYGLLAHPWATLGIFFPFATTLSTLIWQSRNIIWGLPHRDLRQLEQQVNRIKAKGPSHLLWCWVWGDEEQS
ncbi:hypothetical protein [Prochlorothrix hollandica]|uniref:hypothetical protein n=1 Tax=Prochlorothrix hollandica TaxID=1223 RepID=UPI0033404D49